MDRTRITRQSTIDEDYLFKFIELNEKLSTNYFVTCTKQGHRYNVVLRWMKCEY